MFSNYTPESKTLQAHNYFENYENTRRSTKNNFHPTKVNLFFHEARSTSITREPAERAQIEREEEKKLINQSLLTHKNARAPRLPALIFQRTAHALFPIP